MRVKRMVVVSQEILRDSIAGMPRLIKHAVPALVTTEGQNGVRRIENRLQAFLQGLVNRPLDENLKFFEF